MSEERVQRRLAAIVATDVVGYSAMMGRDEAGTLARLKALRVDFLNPKVTEYGGRIVKTTGDGSLIEFPSAVDAVSHAVDVQGGMAKRNALLPEDQQIQIRIGINVGDIIIDQGDIYGDGVNVAARLEALAEPGGVYVSARVHDYIHDRLDVAFDDLGEHAVKNIAVPVHVYRIRRSESADAPVALMPGAPPLPNKPSIAVLPFQNMSGDPEQEYFADGMVEDIITGLSRINWLFVIARNSTFTWKGRAVDVKQVGRELGVRYVLEGSVRKAADRVRVTCQLIDATTGAHVWADRYDRKSDDIFALQDEITLSVVGAIEPSLRMAESERVKRKRPESLDAYDLVLKAMPDVYSRMPEQSARALVLLERALALDPTYALAHGFAAVCHHSIFQRGGLNQEHRTAAICHAEAAIAHGNGDALALALGGFSIGMDRHDRGAAFAAFEAALAVSPSTALTYILGSVIFTWAGDAERSIEWGERGLRLSPFDPWRASAFVSIALGHFQLGRYEQATVASRKAVQASPAFSICYVALAAALAKLGRLDEAKVATARILELQPNFQCSRFLASLDCSPMLAASLGEALHVAGLPK